MVAPEMVRQPSHLLRNKPSSPLLGQHLVDGPVPWGSVTDASDPKVHRSESSSTLQSYYDPLKSPLSVSQQTSASSARDMALRKGCKPIAGPLMQDLSETITYPAAPNTDDINRRMDPAKKKPAHSELLNLSPKPRTSNSVSSEKPTVVKSPSQMSLATSDQRWEPSNRSDWTGHAGAKIEKFTAYGDEVDLKDILRADAKNAKLNVKGPQNAAKNWFDGLGEDKNEVDGVIPSISSERMLPKDPIESVKAGLHEVSRDLRLRQRKSSISDPRRRPSTSRPTLTFQLEPVVVRTPNTSSGDSLHPSGPRSTASSVSRKTRRSDQVKRISLSGVDLTNQSVLLLSSSDDEVDPPTPRRRARIRDSIEVSDIGDENLTYNAETAMVSKPRPVVRVLSGRASNSLHPARVPPVPNMPETPQLYQRASAKKWGADIKSKINSMRVVDDTDIKLKLASMKITDNPILGAEVSAASRTAAKALRSAIPKAPAEHARGSKMMAVTEEEEKLLEAMRKKRASIRKVDFAEGFHKALQLHGDIEPEQRPKTANVDGRPEFFYHDRTATPPPLGHGLRNSLTGAPFAASTDDLVHVDSYPFPETTQRWSRTLNSMPPPDPSPSLSFSPSDILPSPPSSCFSPRTPPPGHGFLEVYEGGVRVSPSRHLRLWDPSRHDRKQSASSGILTPSFGEKRARDFDVEDGMTGWAMDKW